MINCRVKFLILLLFVLIGFCTFAQNVGLYQQYNGKFDFTLVGNTLNTHENLANDACDILTSSSATLTLQPNDVVQNAYLYWAGSGTGDFNIKLNNISIVAQRHFSLTLSSTGLPFFSAFANVTQQIIATGNGNYTLSDLDIASFLNTNDYCSNGTNFAGWALLIVYKNDALPINQLNVYDGLQSVPQNLSVQLSNLNVANTNDAKIGFIAWEGDRNIQVNETLKINGTIISNPPLNPANNAFNGTNSTTQSTTLYNMDLDIYSIENNISIGDTSALIELTSGQDFVMINTIITKLNSQFPDATIAIDAVNQQCNSSQYQLFYTVKNSNSSAILPVNTPIAVYINSVLVAQTNTTTPIAINGSWSSSLIINTNAVATFDITIAIDDTGNSTGIVSELNELNNNYTTTTTTWQSPKHNSLDDLLICSNQTNSFDFLDYQELVLQNNQDVFAGFYELYTDAQNMTNAITNPNNYSSNQQEKEIFVRINNDNCYTITSFLIKKRDCSIIIPNAITPNDDGANDSFVIQNLREFYPNFTLKIYNRWGQLVWQGNNNTNDWQGTSNMGLIVFNKNLPESTYFYQLDFNDDKMPNPKIGWIYIKK